MAQTFDRYELLVVDGNSTDDTAIIARSYDKVCFFQQTGSGFANAWNDGLRRANGDFIAFIDSDDTWTPSKLAKQIDLLRGEPRLEAAIGKVRFVLERGKVPPSSFRDKVLGHDHVAYMPGVLMARRRLFERLGGWSEDWIVASDIDWFLKLKDSGLPIGLVDEVLLYKRVHSRNLSYLTAADPIYPKEILRLLRSSIVRKRAVGGGRITKPQSQDH